MTVVVLTVKVPLEDPLGMVRLDGVGVAEPLSLASVMARPWLGAGLVRVTVPMDELLPATEVGLRVTDDTPDVVGAVANVTST